MPQKDTSQIKEKIISYIRNSGPSLPVHIAKETGLSPLFASAFLSELLSEKILKISNMKVGSSPLYFIPGQEPQLDRFSQYLKSKEKDAYSLLKEKNFLKDKDQEPSIRVALRGIKDFAKHFYHRDTQEIYWRYFTVSESEFYEKGKPKQAEKTQPQMQTSQEKNLELKKKEGEEKVLGIFDSNKSREEKSEKPKQVQQSSKTKISKKKTKRKSSSGSKNDKLFNKVKEHLSKNNQEILDIEEVGKSHLMLKVKDNSHEILVVAYNKKRIAETEINKAFKKASELKIPYKILSFGEPLKKLDNLIQAVKSLEDIEKINN